MPGYEIYYMSSLKYHWDSLKATVHFQLEILYSCYCNHGPPGKFNVPTGSHLFHCSVLTLHCYNATCNLNHADAAWSRPTPGFSLHRHCFCGIFSLRSLLQKHILEGTGQTLIIGTAIRLLPSHIGISFSPVYKCQYGQTANYCFQKKICLSFNTLISCPE